MLTQADKLLVSRLFSLRKFGYYALAWSVANVPIIIAGCVFNVAFPRMSALVSAGDKDAISQSYHRSSQLMAVLIFPVAAVLSLFPYELLRLWTGNNETAASTAPVLSMLVIGSAINAVLYLPYTLQLAFGWTKLPFLAGVASISILVPLMFPMTKHFGLVGAASIWAILNVLNMLIVVPIMHRRLLPRETFGNTSATLGCLVGKHRHRNNRQVGLCVCEGRVTPDDLGLCGVPVAFVFVRRNFDGASYPEQDPTVRCSALVSHKAPKSLILGQQSCHCDGVEGK